MDKDRNQPDELKVLSDVSKELIYSTLKIINKKWIIELVRDMSTVGFYPRRFKEFIALNSGLSSKVLASRLQEMVQNGLINKIVTPTKPPISLYFMTETGRDLMLILSSLAAFGFKWSMQELTAMASGSQIGVVSSIRSPLNYLLKDSASLTLKSISKKWTLDLMTDLRMRKTSLTRFTDFLNFNKKLSRKVLTDTLFRLEKACFIEKKLSNSKTKSVDYVLTEKGNDVDRILYEFLMFGLKWYSDKIFREPLGQTEIDFIVEKEFKLNPYKINYNSMPSIGRINLPKKDN